ncbi:MAG: biopolymer transport protein ExbD [Myxococcota bacterium]|jgi:biopolymer transport protein ExbD
MTTFLNLMVVLVPFLLITAVFSRITIIELSLPTTEGGAASVEPQYRVEVVVRENGLEILDTSGKIAMLPMVDGRYDFAALQQHVIALKQDHPDGDDASVLLEPEIEYDHLIQVMDTLRSAELPAESTDEPPVRLALFSDVAIGDAP